MILEAAGQRGKEATVFATESGEMQTNIAAMGKTYDLTKKGKGSNLLQTTAVSAVRRLGAEMDLSPMDKGIMSSFLSQGGGSLRRAARLSASRRDSRGRWRRIWLT